MCACVYFLFMISIEGGAGTCRVATLIGKKFPLFTTFPCFFNCVFFGGRRCLKI